MSSYIPLILSGVLLNAFAQLFLKKGMLSIGHFEFAVVNIIPIAYKAALSPFIFLGLSCYVLSVALWMLVLSRVDVSFAYPFLSVGYVVTAIIGYAVFNEDLSLYRIGGIVLICLGVIFVAKS